MRHRNVNGRWIAARTHKKCVSHWKWISKNWFFFPNRQKKESENGSVYWFLFFDFSIYFLFSSVYFIVDRMNQSIDFWTCARITEIWFRRIFDGGWQWQLKTNTIVTLCYLFCVEIFFHFVCHMPSQCKRTGRIDSTANQIQIRILRRHENAVWIQSMQSTTSSCCAIQSRSNWFRVFTLLFRSFFSLFLSYNEKQCDLRSIDFKWIFSKQFVLWAIFVHFSACFSRSKFILSSAYSLTSPDANLIFLICELMSSF